MRPPLLSPRRIAAAALLGGRAARAEPPPTVLVRILLSRRENAKRHPKSVRVGYIGADAFVARERGISAAPIPLSLSLSCADTRK